ncbi:hypothetical protein B0J17DRAFT_683483 [Rhizoctonia solani]|nr:hypothetical protein B0J17DRAFT_683483 [Rhizoctonia solani]
MRYVYMRPAVLRQLALLGLGAIPFCVNHHPRNCPTGYGNSLSTYDVGRGISGCIFDWQRLLGKSRMKIRVGRTLHRAGFTWKLGLVLGGEIMKPGRTL